MHEFVEIQNARASTVDLDGWTLGRHQLHVSQHTTIAAGAFRLTTNAPAMPFQWTDPRPANDAARFYRVWFGQ